MEWKDWEGKHVFLRTKNNKVYSGSIKVVDEQSLPLIFLHIIDKYGKPLILVNSEIVEIKEEEPR